MTILRLILGDQLTKTLPVLAHADKERDIILICEVWDEATYIKHHKKKIAFLFSAMRHFAKELEEEGFNVHYTKLDDADNTGSFRGEIERAIKHYKPASIAVTQAGEYRVQQDIKAWEKDFGIPVEVLEDTRFLCGITEFQDWAKDRKGLRMEFFYREMRKKFSILMNGSDPEGGQWNYDKENRESPDGGLFIPKPTGFKPDALTKDAITLVAQKFADHFGDLEPFHYAVTRDQALKVLDDFIKHRLPDFGTYQDAMLAGEPWMYHAHISFYLNCGLLEPLEVVARAEEAYHKKKAPLNAVEGFIRQIIGWREYVRGIYWLKMPDYANENFLNATRKLPWFFWTGQTKMNCLHHCITETKENAYAHHIQRLMVLGNFLLLAGIDPVEVNEWYLIVYADAYEWVEMPNVTGMILFADGGFLASKPYAASGAYIDRMSDYCKGCHYNVKEKTGEKACPFNYLYWDFLIRNKDKLKDNHRMSMIYNSLSKMGDDKVETIRHDSRKFLESLT